jgi:hypothetical protein
VSNGQASAQDAQRVVITPGSKPDDVLSGLIR